MLTPDESRRALHRLFRQRRIANLALLFKTLHTEAPRSVFRRLSLLGYLSSYSHAGGYYTLDDIAEFDSDGLWRYQGVFFSKCGTLKATAVHLVEVAEAGRTHRELETLLAVRVHNSLLDLVRLGRIGRESVSALYLYVSGDHQVAAAQVARRKEQEKELPAVRVAELNPSLVIEVLLEVIHGARVVPDPDVVRARLAMRSVSVALEQVEDIFQTYGLKKKAGSRWTRSRR